RSWKRWPNLFRAIGVLLGNGHQYARGTGITLVVVFAPVLPVPALADLGVVDHSAHGLGDLAVTIGVACWTRGASV
ncbi:MAG TPA: hypothetical protein VGL46_08095, partial [Pseudonocardiaceae bacterium]